MSWTPERKLRAAIDAPLGPSACPRDTRVIERDGWFQRITPSAPGTWHNEVILSSVDERDAERVIDEIIALYRAIGKPTKWSTGPWTRPHDFGDRLARRGFTSWETRGMGCATNMRVAPGTALVRLVEDDSDLDAYVRTNALGWATAPDDVQRDALRRSLGRELVAFVADDLGAGAVLLREDYGYLVGTAVTERSRGRGVYRSLVAARLADLRARGLEYAVTQAREATSAPILEHLGFETLFRGRCYLLSDPATPRG
jgi:ribosomal protein S18 acetylase RimI-like enzyme